MIRILALFALVVLVLVGCDSRPKAVREFSAWWDALPKDEQERILRAPPAADEASYRLNLEDQEEPDHAKYKAWVNSLTPSQMEAYEMHRLQVQSGGLPELDGATIVRPQACVGTWVRSTKCEDGMPRVDDKHCLRCVPGIKESKP